MRTPGWPAPPGRVVMHIDMDAFFAAVEERFLPVLKGRPVVVGGPPNARGVASTAHYEARRYGIHSATPLRTAARLCPHASFITSSEGAYRDFSHRLMSIFQRVAPKVEQTSVDEAFLEVTGMHRHFPTPCALALHLKYEIVDELGLTCSVGIAPNKLLAKMASSQYKPDGLYHVDPDRIEAWLDPQPVSRLWGVGIHTEQTLRKLGIVTIGDLRQLSRQALTALRQRSQAALRPTLTSWPRSRQPPHGGANADCARYHRQPLRAPNDPDRHSGDSGRRPN